MSKFHETLCPKIWDKDELKPEVKAKLKEIASAFIEFLEIPKDAVEDIVVTGSMASYNYTKHSDIDLHIIVNTEKVHKDCPIATEYLMSKKSEFNQKHDIYIYGIPVELYAEPAGVGTVHNGLYSLNKGWIDFPKKIEPTTNDMAVKAKYEEYAEAAKEIKEGDLAEKLLDKIKKMRKAGLTEGGEFSVENLVFKKLRDNGIIERLMKVKKQEYDKKLSLEEGLKKFEDYNGNDNLSKALSILEEISAGLNEMINTGTSAMAPYANNLAGQENPYTKEGKLKNKSMDKRYKFKIRVNGSKKKEDKVQ